MELYFKFRLVMGVIALIAVVPFFIYALFKFFSFQKDINKRGK